MRRRDAATAKKPALFGRAHRPFLMSCRVFPDGKVRTGSVVFAALCGTPPVLLAWEKRVHRSAR
ncbi:MAG: hypothetical protein C6P37_11115 [Caldibacillus debilis]|uniref:Uncharacterized protein n=1 Tax=Caldibacillus debilis TaxID=301148 RepID=A0A3E0K374_9BACI|nr:MAG: hypothetical protein BAA03_05515 [Caldibacillus debilis]REJ13895.1 MAG: hypothetical protein C6W57_15280 [Caldibacillus debilis]REJ27647.1 MAG: hypothetical protein C6P37_11115 [Caldibacillus debilis]REJ30787.1 MAG: hypothetical protein C6W56_02270 [Caldibacillus debilis]